MTAPGSQTARLLLHRFSQQERSKIVESVAKSLNHDSTQVDIDLTATLLEIQPDVNAKELLLDHLQHLLQNGKYDSVVAICSRYAELKTQLIQRAISALADARLVLSQQPGARNPAFSSNTSISEAANGYNRIEQSASSVVDEVVQWLELMCHVISADVDLHTLRVLSQNCSFFTEAADQTLVKTAQKLLVAMLKMQRLLMEDDWVALWDRIQGLIARTDTLHKTVGFSLWLQWLSAEPDTTAITFEDPRYWDLIVYGLRHGDTERRKIALQVLRVSIEKSISTSSTPLATAIPSRLEPASLGAVQKQYGRFCTVFETIVIGRYLNQIQECEADLDFLASAQSLLSQRWLYALLCSALDHRMQDSNRKLIGNWTLRSRIQIDDFQAFIDFFRNAFLPWATGGSLFTSTLRTKDDTLRCEHGESLAAYVHDLITKHVKLASRIIDTILDTILGRYGNNFAYSMVYLIDGIGQAMDSNVNVVAERSHLDKLSRITGWAGFPEVAREYILARSWKISHDQGSKPGQPTLPTLWERIREKSSNLVPGSSVHIDGNIASLTLEPSKRDQHERAAIEKCIAFAGEMGREEVIVDVAHCNNVIEDIWSDLEYLEYPKSLLVVVPTLIFHPHLFEAACPDSIDGSQLAETLTKKTNDLLGLCESRSYLLAPLLRALRSVAIHGSNASAPIQLEDVIVHVAGHPCSPTVDARLEDAVVPLLRSLGPGMAKFSYVYYFGPREGHGMAALLDLVSRMWGLNIKMAQRTLHTLLEQWRTQKNPPPVVSPWKTTLQLQVMLLCCEQHMGVINSSQARTILKDLHYILAIEPLPRYRYLLEWMIARIYIHQPDLRPTLLDELSTKDHHTNPKFLASLMKLGVMLVKTEGADEPFACQLVKVFIPLAASSKVIIRHEAQWQIPILMDHAKAQGWESVSQDPGLLALDEYIRSLERFGDPPMERRIDKLDPIRDHNLTHLVEGSWYGLDGVEQRQTCREDFVRLYELDSEISNQKPLPPSCMPLGDPVHRTPSSSGAQVHSDRKILQNIDTISHALDSSIAPIALQTKGAAVLEGTRQRYENLLVVASLVDNPYNLGGLSRVSEIFGAGAMYMQSRTVTSNRDFTNVSVSSHLHFPILPLPAENVAQFLARKKAEEGFNVVGIEQTDRSVTLGSAECVLPEKCILVIGSEREGIPALVLGECDMLVEIPQLGITRSLNVQTAAAIVLCEYAKQYKK